MPRQILLKTHLQLTLLLVLLTYDGDRILASPLSTTLKYHAKENQIGVNGYKDFPGPSGVDLPNGRKLLSTSPKNVSKDNSIGAKIREFYADDNNMALFCVLPLLILVYGGCSVIYCIHKCKKSFKKKKREDTQRSKSQGSLSCDNVSLISGTDNVTVKPKHQPRPFSSSNRVGPAPPYDSGASGVPQKLKLDRNSHVKDLLTDYEFFASWVMAQKAADLIQLQGDGAEASPSMSRSENLSRNCGTTVGGRKKKLVFLS